MNIAVWARKVGITYWQGGDYVGVGPGAHGRLTIRRSFSDRTSLPADELAFRRRKMDMRPEILNLFRKRNTPECLMMGLRMSTGVDRDLFAIQTGNGDASMDQSNAEALVNAGLVELDEKGLND